jgi:DNA-directed RNA polymerase specialized sigma24 family protein
MKPPASETADATSATGRLAITSNLTARFSYRYIAGWGEDGALDAIRQYAETIDAVARRIENTLNPEPDPTPPAADAAVDLPLAAWGDVHSVAARPGMVGQGLAALPRTGRMQPPTEPLQQQPTIHPLRGDEAELYHRHHNTLVLAISTAVDASAELIEDACQTAWTILLRRQPNRATVAGWLYIVALRETYRLAGIERRELHIADLSPDIAWDNQTIERVSLDDQLEARDALRALAQLPNPQRRDLTLLVAGYSHRDIAHMTGGRTRTNVNNHLVKARARIGQYRSDDTMSRSDS